MMNVHHSDSVHVTAVFVGGMYVADLLYIMRDFTENVGDFSLQHAVS